ncbi:MAG: phage head morphogenesis protein [Pyrinomonadaceae bacterium]|nr:phage head morphogenesis protein [Pyrinomonadaceae bacterium]
MLGTYLDRAVRLIIDKLRGFFKDNKYTDFNSAEDFADKLLDALENVQNAVFSSSSVRDVIKRTTKSIYEFYRLKDASPFGETSPIKLRLGGADINSIKFIEKLDHFYLSKFADNTSQPLRKFFIERYLANGAVLFESERSAEFDLFREQLGEKYQRLNDRQIQTIIQTSVQRIRNWAHIGSLSQAELEKAKIVAVLDSRTTEICRELDGKIFRIGVAQKSIERLNQLEPGAFAKEMYESNIGKAISKEPVKTVQSFLEKDGKTISDDLVKTGRGFPPLHPNCRSRIQGLIPGIDDDA